LALEGIEDFEKLEKQGYEVTKVIERSRGGAKYIMTNIKTGAKKVVVMSTRDREKLELRDSTLFSGD